MKHSTRIWLAVFSSFCLHTVVSSAQTFSIGDIVQPYEQDGLYHAKVNVTNTSGTNKTLKVNAFLEGKQEDHLSYFCTGSLCYGPLTTEVTYEMPAGATDSVVSYLETQGVNGTSTIRYVFSDADNPDDKTEQTFTFIVGPTSVPELTNSVIVLSSPMPNPAIETATITYAMPESSAGRIELFSADSKLLKTFPLSAANGSLVIPTAQFASGSYFYALIVDEKNVAINTLIITR